MPFTKLMLVRRGNGSVLETTPNEQLERLLTVLDGSQAGSSSQHWNVT